jgi:hypothetical protein
MLRVLERAASPPPRPVATAPLCLPYLSPGSRGVYDITEFVGVHPGGNEKIMLAGGPGAGGPEGRQGAGVLKVRSFAS